MAIRLPARNAIIQPSRQHHGKSLRQIVLATRQPPEVLRKVYREWQTGLAEGERSRRAQELRERERRELLEDERLHLAQMKALAT
jgi:hypothetical protein